MLKKTIAVLLALLFAVSILASCGKNGGGKTEPTETAAGTGSETKSEEAEMIDTYVKGLAGDYDVSGKTFTYIGPSNGNFPTEDKETGDILSDAVYYRQRDLVEIFGIDWDPVQTTGGEETKDSVIEEVLAGGSEYDLVCGGMLTCGQALLNAGVLQTVNDLDHVDLGKEWWVSTMEKTFSVDGKLFFLFGPIVPYTYYDTQVTLFNKSLTKMFGISDDDLYGSVKAGEWTFDELERFAKEIPEVTSPTTGVFRYVHPTGVSFLFAAGMTITKFDEDGLPYVDDVLPLELSDLSDRLVGTFGDDSQCAYLASGEEAMKKFGVEKLEQLFNSNRALFFFADTGDVSYMRNNSVEFGILPMPKASTAQKEYRSYSNPWVGTAVYLPKNVKDKEMSDLLTEAMAALSQKYVKTAYYDKMLRSQAIFDLDSQDMLEIIFSTKIYDMSVLYSNGSVNTWGPFLDCIDKSLSIDNSTFASEYKANARVANMNIKTLIKTVKSGG